MTTERPPQMERAALLRAETHPVHERLDARIMEQRPFETLERYAAFVRGQLAFQHRLEPLYRDERLGALIPGLAERSRLAAIEADLADLGRQVPERPAAPEPCSLGEALGWLYVSEGSTLGAAFLLKEVEKLGLGAERGGRHLAPHAEGRGLHWRRFVERLNAAPLDESGERSAIDGAHAAFTYVWDRFEIEFARVGP